LGHLRIQKMEEREMAKVAGNIVLHGAHGKLGDQIVIRQRSGTTILSQAPVASGKEPTAAQAAHRLRFQLAVLYGKKVLGDATLEAEYAARAEGLKNAYNVAVADFLHAPDIDEIDVTNYHGAVGDTIRIRVTDDFEVKQVTVAIHNGDGSLVEEGDAVQQDDVIDWLYTATAENTEMAGDRIEIKAMDRPGNITEEEQPL
jgi:hypothetical protein